jgi:DNA invertase Pin-like site-specific DNA recombinase
MSQERRAAIYLRVSSDEQTYENQRPDVKRLARTRGYKLVATYEEQASAAKARPEYARMMGDAHRGMFDVLVVWALDRFGRSMVGNMQAVLDLDRRGVEVVTRRACRGPGCGARGCGWSAARQNGIGSTALTSPTTHAS